MEKSPRIEGGYFSVIGDSWAGAHQSHHRSADQPFVGVRFEKGEGWVVVEPRNPACLVDTATMAEIMQMFEGVDSEAWCDEQVFICRARSIRQGHAVARRVVSILQRRQRQSATPNPRS